ncbi:hypothetical protein A2732_00010 [Candidatus Nomurabacteria bacterium RIFCSPHIGHO2_01_FULL_40_10]|nr:MAG: hypothetical protein A2732_00010 [Candidatus Nomurabacteria bacterium RIFCSPHIGHO2_01_FULL_40_10]
MVKHIESGMSGRMMGFNSLSWIRDVAMKLEIKGAVFTRPDGSIKVVAEGEEKNLIEFTEEIKEGRIFSEVENFYVKWNDSNKDLGDFYIIPK